MRETLAVKTAGRPDEAPAVAKRYRVRVAGRIFENSDPKVLIRSAVAARRASRPSPCRNCGRGIADRELSQYGYCITCIEGAVAALERRRRSADCC
jgi:hypothetical protein